uniref:U21-Hexatoxin-Hc1a_1 n=1 Tax=Hadronyche cerberea TaxID=1107879 RepID=A0A4Q8KAY9_HADCE
MKLGITLALTSMLAFCVFGDKENEDLMENVLEDDLLDIFMDAIHMERQETNQECIAKWKSCAGRKLDCCEGLECWKRTWGHDVCVPITQKVFCLAKWKSCFERKYDCCEELECWERRGNKHPVCAPKQ